MGHAMRIVQTYISQIDQKIMKEIGGNLCKVSANVLSVRSPVL